MLILVNFLAPGSGSVIPSTDPDPEISAVPEQPNQIVKKMPLQERELGEDGERSEPLNTTQCHHSRCQVSYFFNVHKQLVTSKTDNVQCHVVLRIRDVYPGSEFFPSRIPDPGSKFFPDPHPHQRI